MFEELNGEHIDNMFILQWETTGCLAHRPRKTLFIGVTTDTFKFSCIPFTYRDDIISWFFADRLNKIMRSLNIDRRTNIMVSDYMAIKTHPIVRYLSIVRVGINFKFARVSLDRIMRTVATLHPKFIKRWKIGREITKYDYSKLYRHLLHKGKCPWITNESDIQIANNPPTIYKRHKCVSVCMYFMAIVAYNRIASDRRLHIDYDKLSAPTWA